LVGAFEPRDPLTAHAGLGNSAHFERFAPLRQGIPRDRIVARLAAEALVSLGVDPTRTAMDRPRIRAISSGAHRIAEALPAYGLHRDTWYANPQAQINHWIPLHDLLAEERMALFPWYFARPIANTSAAFDLAEWDRLGGFQAYATPRRTAQPHPVPIANPPWDEAIRPDVPLGSTLRFSGHHLHGPVPHDSGRTRYTLELRVVDVVDLSEGRGAPRLDNASRGDAAARYESMTELLSG
jgi:hypothetical protein